MSLTTVSSMQGQYADATAGQREASEFFRRHPVTGIVRGLLFSSVLWVLLAVGVYAVYSIVRGG
jgi:hypothetical protein